MKNLMDKIIVKRHHLILNENDVTKTLMVINKHHNFVPDMKVGNCGWADTDKWFIHFDATESKWDLIRQELNVIRVYDVCDIPQDTNGVVYSDD